MNRMLESINGEATSPAETEWPGTKWEYLSVLAPPDNEAIASLCSQQGDQGWELTAMMAVNVPQGAQMDPVSGQIRQTFVPACSLMFKRPKV